MIDLPAEARRVAVEGVQLGRQRRPAEAVRRTADLGERDRLDARGQGVERAVALRPADEPQERDPRHQPERRVQAVGDRLGGVRRGRARAHRRGAAGARSRVRAAGRDGAQKGPAEAARLDGRADEEHREEPQPVASEDHHERIDRRPLEAQLRAPVADGAHGGPSASLGDEERRRIGTVEVRVQAKDRGEVVGDLRLGETAEVVVERLAPDRRAGRQVSGRGRSDAMPGRRDHVRARRRVRGHASSGSSAGPPWRPPPVASRSSSACMKASRSPSRTACVFPVSWPVRRSLTIW